MEAIDDSGLLYRATLGAFISRSENEDSGYLQASLGGSTGTSVMYRKRINPVFTIYGAVTNQEVWPDRPVIQLAIQARDTSYNSLEIEVVLSSGECSSNLSHEVFGPEPTNISIPIPQSWFSTSTTTVDISVRDVANDNTYYIAQVELKATQNCSVNESVFMRLPMHPVQEREVHIPIYSTFEFFLSSFSLDCSVSLPARILGASAPYNWSLLTSFFPESNDRISLTAFRNYDKFSSESTGFQEDLLANITVQMPVDQPTVNITCKAVNIILTTNERLQGDILVLDRNGCGSDNGRVYSEAREIVGLFAYTDQNEVINTARLTGERTSFHLTVLGYNTYGYFDPVSTGLSCVSDNHTIIQTAENCSEVYFDGSETSGSDAVNITIHHGNLNEFITFTVWSPSLPLQLLLEDSTLNPIDIGTDNESCSVLYQKTRLSITTDVSTGSKRVESVSVSPLLYQYLKSSNTNVIEVDNITGEVKGILPGVASVYVDHMEYSASVNITVADLTDAVTPVYLDVFAYTDIVISIPPESLEVTPLDRVIANISLVQDFQYVNSEVTVTVMAVFSDGQRMEINEDMGLDVNFTQGDRLSPGRYQIIKHINEVTVDAVWASCLQGTIYRSLTVQVEIETPSISIVPSSGVITNDGDPATLSGIQTMLSLRAYLTYSDNRTVDITQNNNTVFNSTNSLLDIYNKSRVRSISDMDNADSAIVTVSYRDDNWMGEDSMTVAIVQMRQFLLKAHPYPSFEGSREMNVSTLRRIGSSDDYQQAQITASLLLSNGMEFDVSNQTTFHSIPPKQLSSSDTLKVSNARSVTLSGELDDLTSESLTIQIEDSPVHISSIDKVIFSDFVAENGTVEYADCQITLADGTKLQHTFEKGNPLYPGLIIFSTPDTEVIDVMNPKYGNVTLLRNSYQHVQLMAESAANQSVYNQSVYNSAQFYCNLLPSLHDIDLGSDSETPLESTTVNSAFEVPVTLNSPDMKVGVYELDMNYDPELVRFMEIEQGDSWRNGSVVHTDIQEGGRVAFGGVLNTGANGMSVHLATLKFTALTKGIANFNISVTLLAEANINTTEIRSRDVPPSSMVQINIKNKNQEKRSAEFEEPPLAAPPLISNKNAYTSRVKRQDKTCIDPPLGDVNGDCSADLRDVYLLQVYVAAQVHNFTSVEGMAIQNEVSSESIQKLDFDGDGVITASEVFTAEKIGYEVVYEIVNISSTITPDYTICRLEVTGVIQTPTGEPADNTNLFVFVDFSHSNSTFQDEFDKINFTDGSRIVAYKSDPTSYGGIVRAHVHAEHNETVFVVQANSAFEIDGFNISVIHATTDEEDRVNDARLSGPSSTLTVYDSQTAQNLINADVERLDTDVGRLDLTFPEDYTPLMVTGIIDICILPFSSTPSPTPTPSPSPSTPSPSNSSVVPSTTPTITEAITTIPFSSSQLPSEVTTTIQMTSSQLPPEVTTSIQMTSSQLPPEVTTSIQMTSSQLPSEVTTSIQMTSSQLPSEVITTIQMTSSQLPSAVQSSMMSSQLPSVAQSPSTTVSMQSSPAVQVTSSQLPSEVTTTIQMTSSQLPPEVTTSIQMTSSQLPSVVTTSIQMTSSQLPSVAQSPSTTVTVQSSPAVQMTSSQLPSEVTTTIQMTSSQLPSAVQSSMMSSQLPSVAQSPSTTVSMQSSPAVQVTSSQLPSEVTTTIQMTSSQLPPEVTTSIQMTSSQLPSEVTTSIQMTSSQLPSVAQSPSTTVTVQSSPAVQMTSSQLPPEVTTSIQMTSSQLPSEVTTSIQMTSSQLPSVAQSPSTTVTVQSSPAVQMTSSQLPSEVTTSIQMTSSQLPSEVTTSIQMTSSQLPSEVTTTIQMTSSQLPSVVQSSSAVQMTSSQLPSEVTTTIQMTSSQLPSAVQSSTTSSQLPSVAQSPSTTVTVQSSPDIQMTSSQLPSEVTTSIQMTSSQLPSEVTTTIQMTSNQLPSEVTTAQLPSTTVTVQSSPAIQMTTVITLGEVATSSIASFVSSTTQSSAAPSSSLEVITSALFTTSSVAPSSTPVAEPGPSSTPATETSPSSTPVTEAGPSSTPVTETSPSSTPVAETSPSSTPVAEPGPSSTPVAETSPSSTPVAEPGPSSTPVAETSPSSTPVAETSPSSTPVAETSPSSTPVAETGPSSTPVAETSPSSTPVAETSPSSTPVAEPGPSSTPVAEAGPSSTPVAETSPSSTPVAETGPSSTPVTEAGPSSTPVAETSPSSTPAAEPDPSSTPATEAGPSSTPVAETGPSSTPSPSAADTSSTPTPPPSAADTSSSSTLSQPTKTPTQPEDSAGSSSTTSLLGIIIGGMLSVILILAAIIIIFVSVYCVKKARKKGIYHPNIGGRPNSRTSKDYWFEEEEKIVSPSID